MPADMKKKKLIPVVSEDEIKPKFMYMKNLVKASKFILMWPCGGGRWKGMLFHSAVWLINIYCALFILTFFFRIKMDYRNMDGITEMIDFITVFISGFFRYVYVYIRGDDYLHLVSLIHHRFIHYPFFPGKNRASLDKYYNLAKRIIMAYGCFTFFWILQVCFVPLLSFLWAKAQSEDFRAGLNETEGRTKIEYPVIMNVYVPFDITTQPNNGMFYAYQVAGFLMFGTIYVVVDSFWYMVIILTIGQFALIKESLNRLQDILDDYKDSNEVRLLDGSQVQEVKDGLKKCIKHHQFTRSFVHKIDNINNPNIMVDSLHAVISIGFILLDVTIALNQSDWNKVMYSFEYFVTSIVHMFFFDWLGNELAVKEEELAEAIYQIPWYICPSEKTEFLLVTIQSRRPYRLTGGKMYKLSLEFFTSTVKAVFSYFTFLHQMRTNRTASKD